MTSTMIEDRWKLVLLVVLSMIMSVAHADEDIQSNNFDLFPFPLRIGNGCNSASVVSGPSNIIVEANLVLPGCAITLNGAPGFDDLNVVVDFAAGDNPTCLDDVHTLTMTADTTTNRTHIEFRNRALSEAFTTASIDVASSYNNVTVLFTECNDAADIESVLSTQKLTAVFGRAGNDTVTVEATVGTSDSAAMTFLVDGEEGDDTLDASKASVSVHFIGGEGADTLLTGSGDDVVFGDYGSIIEINGTTTILSMNTSLGGNDYIELGEGNDIGIGGAGHDEIRGDGGMDILVCVPMTSRRVGNSLT